MGKGTIAHKVLAYLVILWFERWCPKQNTVARFKSKNLAPQKFCAGCACIFPHVFRIRMISYRH